MQFTQHPHTGRHVVRGYSTTAVQIGDRNIESSCAFSATELLAPWPVRSVAGLTLEDFATMLQWQPEIILLGTGAKQIFPSPQLLAAIRSRNVGFEVMDTGAACRTFNVLSNEERRIVAALVFDRN